MSKSLNQMLQQQGYNNGDAENDDVTGQLPLSLQGASKEVLKRVKALKKIQYSGLELEAQFYQEVHQLEIKFAPLFAAVGEKRKSVVTGDYEPADYECDMPLINDMEPDELQQIENNAPVEGSPSKGIPGFWYHVLKNSTVGLDIYECDEPILKNYLQDLTLEVHEDPAGFSILFHFAQNPYFSNMVLKKYYEMDVGIPEGDNPFHYEGPTIKKCAGTEIEWANGKNVTLKAVKKVLKKGPNAGKPITRMVANESFFSFFNPEETEDKRDLDPEVEETLHRDFENGQTLRDEIIPRAVLYFTGEACDMEDDDYLDDEEDEDENDNSEHDD